MAALEPEEMEYWCTDCGCEISYYQWLERGAQTEDEGWCEECWQEFLDGLFEEPAE
jgi:DNA-directed RNA polymerase subunit RPC12/RpoP